MAPIKVPLCKDFKLDRRSAYHFPKPVQKQSTLTSLLYVGFGMTIPVMIWQTGIGHAAVDFLVFCIRKG